jgi:hypothetical protein
VGELDAARRDGQPTAPLDAERIERLRVVCAA